MKDTAETDRLHWEKKKKREGNHSLKAVSAVKNKVGQTAALSTGAVEPASLRSGEGKLDRDADSSSVLTACGSNVLTARSSFFLFFFPRHFYPPRTSASPSDGCLLDRVCQCQRKILELSVSDEGLWSTSWAPVKHCRASVCVWPAV